MRGNTEEFVRNPTRGIDLSVSSPVQLFCPNLRHVIRHSKPHLREKETAMFVIIKWIVGALLAGFAWLVTGYTIEYFRPYKQINIRKRG